MMNQALTNEEKIQELKDRYCKLYEGVHGLQASWVYGQLIPVEELEFMVDQYTFFLDEEIRRKATAH